MEDKEKIEVDTDELWKQMIKDSEHSPYKVTFEAIEIDGKGKTACCVHTSIPAESSNYQHASLFNGMFKFMREYVDEIKTFEELESKMLPLNEIRESMVALSMFLFEKMIKLAPPEDKEKLAEELKKLKDEGEQENG